VRRSGTSEFSNSARAELFAYRKRKKTRIRLHLQLDAQSKKRQNTGSVDQQFISEVEKALAEQGRQAPFRVPVAVRMHFHVGLERTPPQIHQLPKHYLDLLQARVASRPADRRPLLLQDDRLVHALFCSYSFADEEPSAPFMTFEVTTLTNFIRDLELHQRIGTGDFDEIDGVRELGIKHPYGLGDYEDELRDESLDEYRRLMRLGERGRERYGEKLYDALLLMNQQSAQHEILERRELRLVDIATLYGPAPRRQRHDDLFRSLREISAANVRVISTLGVASADLGPPPAQQGDSDIVKGKVRAALEKMRNQYSILNPLFSTVGVTVLYVRPLKAQAIDLDNLARRFIVPIVHEELKPPATHLHAIQHLKPDGVANDWVRNGLERLRRAHKHQIMRYQVFALPRIEEDPLEGKVSILIHGGDEIDRQWNNYRRELDAWEGVVARSWY
jgi:hypothetical protein